MTASKLTKAELKVKAVDQAVEIARANNNGSAGSKYMTPDDFDRFLTIINKQYGIK